MKLGRFEAILDAYGADPGRWPERERADALALARSSLVAARALAEARRLDAALGAWKSQETLPESTRLVALRARIVAAAGPRARNWFFEWFGVDLRPTQLWPSAAGLALMTGLGFAVGFGGLMQVDANHDAEDTTIVSSLDFAIDGSGQ
jgi:hypothetical protein